ncbi:MAG: YCF48-related protein [Ignavibacteria bacterium]
MKKIIISAFFIFFLVTGFRGCNFDSSIFGVDLKTLMGGFLYDNKDSGFITWFYITAGEHGKIFTNEDPVTDFWIERNSGTTNQINFVRAAPEVDTAIVYAVGDNGTILKSPDRGIDWTVLSSPTTRNLYGIDFSNFNSPYVVGDSGLILKSSNAGSTWEFQNSGVNRRLNSIYSLGNLLAIAVGEKGTILKTTNAGTNWQNISLNDTTTDLNKVGQMGSTFFGIIAGIVGDNGKMYRSSDYTFWNPVETGITNDLSDFLFNGNGASGFLTGDSGTVIYTTNSGVTWTSSFFIQSLTSEDVKAAIRVNDSTFAGIAGNEFIIFSANEDLLPVELSAFSAAVNNNDVILSWTTLSESNNKGFEVERSMVNNEWTKAGYVEGSGSSSEPVQYSFKDNRLQVGKYNYRLKQIDYNGNFEYHDLNNEVEISMPDEFILSQNYPNPFNPVTKIDFEIPSDGNVKIKVYDAAGKLISSLIDEYKTAGFYSLSFNAVNFSSGVYFYRMEFSSAGQTQHKVMKMLLTK